MLKEYDLIVVGAGPAGSIAAYNAAIKDISVLILEKDREVGIPVRCGEAVSRRSLTLHTEPDPKWICAEINKFGFISPDDTEIIIEFEDTGFILDRKLFDAALAKKAINAGAHLITKAYVNGLLFEGDKVSGVKYIHQDEQLEIRSKLVIAADGVESRVGRWAGINTTVSIKEMESCYQVVASGLDDIDINTCKLYFGNQLSPEGYLWVFPKSENTANIGLGVSGLKGKSKHAKEFLENFLQAKYPNASIISQVAGGVPCAVTLEKIYGNGILLAGDAARQVNPLSGGGISSGMMGGKLAGEIAAEAIITNNLASIYKYQEAWHEKLGKKHLVYNRLKDGIFHFDDSKFNSIAHSFAKVPPAKRTLGKLFTAALINNPSLILDAAKVFF